MFKLYLYGIEILIVVWRLRTSKVQIVPLWNWNCKPIMLERLAIIVQIVPLWNWNDVGSTIAGGYQGSNCTFMELKCKNAKSGKFSPTFKLYLYGIEIMVTELQRLVPLVQIVPLWNWNTFSQSSNAWLSLFKLYLYGIEMLSLIIERNIIDGSNCTFMELKYIFHRLFPTWRVF